MKDRKTLQRESILAECEQKKIRVQKRGVAFFLTGNGVSVMTSDLANLEMRDLEPCLSEQGTGMTHA